jgi:integrase
VKVFRGADAARVRYLTIAECKRLLNGCEPDFRNLVRAALETGARYGEISRLKVGDYNADVGTVAIRVSKTATPRHVVLTADGVSFFQSLCAGRAGNDVMLPKANGSAWLKSHQLRPMKAACQRAKIAPPLNFHGLRHCWASHAVMAGVPLLVVSKNLGHADTRMVEKHYGHNLKSNGRRRTASASGWRERGRLCDSLRSVRKPNRGRSRAFPDQPTTIEDVRTRNSPIMMLDKNASEVRKT